MKNGSLGTEAARKLEFLNRKILIHTTLSGKELVGKYAENPITNNLLPIYPASFVKSDNGTGIVMSVPGHAPYDYQALVDLKTNNSILDNFKLGKIVDPISIISSGDSQDIELLPALEVIRKYQIVNQSDKKLEDGDQRIVFARVLQRENEVEYWQVVGMSVAEAKDMVRNELVTNGIADTMIELTNRPVKCRCGAECVVKILDDQWFINYGDQKWKTLAHECVNKMDILPEEIRQEFNHVIDWLRERACARKSGLGTRLPWDTNWIIESLSDSVIYMAYYIIAKYNSNLSTMKNLIPIRSTILFLIISYLGKERARL